MARKKRYYTDEDWEIGVNPSRLARFGPVRQLEYARHWFNQNFEDPAQQTPHNSQEGGYLYIWGGPYDARDVLGGEFGGILSDEVIEMLAQEVESDGTVDWAPGRNHPDHERAAEESERDYKSEIDLDKVEMPPHLEADLRRYLTRLEGGEQPATPAELSSEDREAERRARQDVADKVTALRGAIDQFRAPHGGMGHNGPALDDNGNPLPDGFDDELRDAANELQAAVEAPVPDALRATRAATKLNRFLKWLQPRLDLAADEFAKGLGKWASGAVVIACAALLPPIKSTIVSTLHWLSVVLPSAF